MGRSLLGFGVEPGFTLRSLSLGLLSGPLPCLLVVRRGVVLVGGVHCDRVPFGN